MRNPVCNLKTHSKEESIRNPVSKAKTHSKTFL